MTHYMNLWDDSFCAIKEGWKTIEMRLNDEKRAAIKIDDIIEFTNVATKEKITCNVNNLFRYPDFSKLYENHDKLSIGYKEDEIANPDDMLTYYTKEQIEKYGVVGIEIEVERWDAYNNNLTKIEGVTLTRGLEIPEGYYHLVGEIIVRHTDGTYLIMQRDPRKHLGGMWEATAGGSALQGEEPLTCAIRELKEETGIVSDNLTEVGRILHHEHQTYYVEYICVTDVDKESIALQEGETSAYKWVTCDELRLMSPDELTTQRIQNFIKELR